MAVRLLERRVGALPEPTLSVYNALSVMSSDSDQNRRTQRKISRPIAVEGKETRLLFWR